MKKKVPKLKLPLWQDIIYFVLIGIGPVVITALEIFQSHSSAFKITFTSVMCVLLVIIIIRRFFLKGKVKEIEEKIVLTEHDYSMEIGNKQNAEILWSRYSLFLYMYHAIVMVLAVILAVLFVTALSEQLIQFKGAAIAIFGCVIAALVFKIACFLVMINSSAKINEGNNDEKQTK